MMNIFVGFNLLLLALSLVGVVIAKKRMDRNEPVFGWRRKQFLAEQAEGEAGGKQANTEKTANKREKKDLEDDGNHETIKDLLEVKQIEYGIIHKERNEYCIALSSDFVNFDLLKPSEQIGILQGYQQLHNVVNFPVQILAQAVRQDFRKERVRFEGNLKKCNPQTRKYNMDVIDHIQSRTMDDFRITLKIYYIVNYNYEPSRMAELTQEQKKIRIIEELYLRGNIIRRALTRAKVDAEIMDSIHALEMLKRSMNRDRMVLHPIEDVAEKEKMAAFVTMDPTTIPGFEDLVHDAEEATYIVKDEETIQEEENRQAVASA